MSRRRVTLKEFDVLVQMHDDLEDAKKKVDEANVRLIEKVKALEGQIRDMHQVAIDREEAYRRMVHDATRFQARANGFRDLLFDLVVAKDE